MGRIFFAEFRRLFHFRLYYIECAAVVLFSVLYFKPPVIDSFLFYIMTQTSHIDFSYAP